MRIRIYDTEGKLRYGRSEDDQRNRFVSEVYRNAKLRFLIDTRGDSFRVLCYVRAVESEGQRSEQFYVDMVSDTPVELSEFRREAVKTLRKVFHEIDLSNPTTDVFEYLDADMDASQLLPEDDLHAVRSLADQGETLDFGAGDQRAALSVAKALGGIPAKVVIADAGRTEYYDDAEVVLDTGFDGEGIAASKKTTEKIKQYLESQSKSAAEKKIADIEKQAKELKEIKREEGLSDSEVDKPLRNVLKTQFPGIFRSKKKEETGAEKRTRKETQTTRSKKTKPETTTKPADVSSDGDDSEKGGFVNNVPTKALGGVLVVALIVLVVGGAAATGFIPLPDMPPDSDDTDDTDTEQPSENTSDNIGFVETSLTSLNELDEPIRRSTLTVNGTVNSTDRVTVNGILTGDDDWSDDDEDVTNGSFNLTYEEDDVRDIGNDIHRLTLNLSISQDGEYITSETAEFDWDVRVPPTLNVTNSTVEGGNNTSTVSVEVENIGTPTDDWEGRWRMGLLVDGNDSNSSDVELDGGETHIVNLTADTELTSESNVTVTCEPQNEESKCEPKSISVDAP